MTSWAQIVKKSQPKKSQPKKSQPKVPSLLLTELELLRTIQIPNKITKEGFDEILNQVIDLGLIMTCVGQNFINEISLRFRGHILIPFNFERFYDNEVIYQETQEKKNRGKKLCERTIQFIKKEQKKFKKVTFAMENSVHEYEKDPPDLDFIEQMRIQKQHNRSYNGRQEQNEEISKESDPPIFVENGKIILEDGRSLTMFAPTLF